MEGLERRCPNSLDESQVANSSGGTAQKDVTLACNGTNSISSSHPPSTICKDVETLRDCCADPKSSAAKA
jgi:hypothetical protein